jgi:hypothetical protein
MTEQVASISQHSFYIDNISPQPAPPPYNPTDARLRAFPEPSRSRCALTQSTGEAGSKAPPYQCPWQLAGTNMYQTHFVRPREAEARGGSARKKKKKKKHPARSDRDRAVLQSLTQPGASDWLLALPVPHLQQTMPPESFRCRLQYQLLIPIFQPGSQCPCCLRELDVWGDHAVHCTSGGDVAIVGRHYSVRNGLDAVLTSAGQRVTREPAFPTPVPGQERRRADLRLHAWEEGRDLYIDIVGSSPLTVANLLHFVPGGAAARAAQDKQTRYAVLLSRQQPPVAFQAFAFETFGGLHADALALLQRLQGLLNQALIAQEDVEGYFVIRRVSFIIAAAVGRQLAARRV